MGQGDTIAAQATAPGRAGIAVIRISGPQAGSILDALSGGPRPSPRQATLTAFKRPGDRELLDRGLALWFPAPHSFTGEDVAELHGHGGLAVVAALLAEITHFPGCRLAEPGEFTRRAFDNGKLDLTQVEGLADLVNAEAEAQRKQAMRQLDGALGLLYEGWRAELIGAMARIEAGIDFPDEDLPDDLLGRQRSALAALVDEIARHLADDHRGERLRDGFHIVILGAPNVGKSSLLNALARREAAIVSERAGTTRDVVEVHLDLGGYPVILADTAGLRHSGDSIESEGMRRALQRAEQADLRLLVYDAAIWSSRDQAVDKLVDEGAFPVANKCDLVDRVAGPGLAISALTGAGIGELLRRLQAEVARRLPMASAPAPTRLRHRRALEDCGAALERALAGAAEELVAEDLRLAARALGRITGRVDVEDILDVVFAEFCLGK